MNVRHQQLGAADEFAVLLPLDGTHGDLTAFVDVEAVGLSRIHLGMGSAVAVQGTLADLSVDASRDEEGDADVVVFQLKRLVETKQGMLGGTVGRTQREAEQAR